MKNEQKMKNEGLRNKKKIQQIRLKSKKNREETYEEK